MYVTINLACVLTRTLDEQDELCRAFGIKQTKPSKTKNGGHYYTLFESKISLEELTHSVHQVVPNALVEMKQKSFNMGNLTNNEKTRQAIIEKVEEVLARRSGSGNENLH